MIRPLILSLLSTVVVIALASPVHARAKTVEVYASGHDFSINPPGQPIVDAVITVGDTIRWVWVDGSHTTTSVAGIPEQWNAPLTQSSPTFEKTFTHVGTWWYYCIPHGFDNGDQTAGGMAGTITVLPPGSGACCMIDGSCMITTPAECFAEGGTYQGDGMACTPNPCAMLPVTLTFDASRDVVIYEDAEGDLSNSRGQHLWMGNRSNGLKRRSLIAFDVSGIPAGAIIQDAQLRLYCNQSLGAPVDLTVHRLLADWGEGSSIAPGDEGAGGGATALDATWLHRFYNVVFWKSPGGDFEPVASASQTIDAENMFYTWSSRGLAGDVQRWLDDASTNFGWIIRGDEVSGSNGKRFVSRDSISFSHVPQLTVTYLPKPTTGACCMSDGSCMELAEMECGHHGGTYHGDGTMCEMAGCSVELEPFVDPLPLPAIAQPVIGKPGGAAHYEIAMTEFYQQLHRDLPPTRVWGYGGSFPGPTIEARRDEPVTATWINDLRYAETGELRSTHVFPIDECIHGPDVTGQMPMTVVHLHGGSVPADSDGHPEYSFAPGEQSELYTYPNHQPAATLWYHDHALGITRLNVMMGLAGFYLIRDDVEDALNIPRGEFEIPLVIQDRSFNADGSLHYHDMWHEHFFGDTILVNGKVWPYLNVKQGKYRFRLLNGSNSRVYALSLSNGATFWQIGSDTGLLQAPVPLSELVISPGERADIVIDFEPYAAGTEIILTNSAPAPYPNSANVGIVPNVMKFIVQDAPGDIDPLPAKLAAVPRMNEADAVIQRDFQLRQMADMHCPNHPHGMWMINGLMWDDITEYPRLGDTEIWAWWNYSGITHPMHMHLVSFQVLDRQDFDPVTGEPTGPRIPPAANEMGWKDTVQAAPNQVTRVIAKFEHYTGLFAYHCHILEHEDHEMMRQFKTVLPCPADIAPPNQGNGVVQVEDLLAVIVAWGRCPADNANCPADINGDGIVDTADLLAVINAWGPCP